MRKHKPIAEIAREVMRENNIPRVMYGDCHALDEIASRCTHRDLMKMHPLDRHKVITSALRRSKLFRNWLHGVTGYTVYQLIEKDEFTCQECNDVGFVFVGKEKKSFPCKYCEKGKRNKEIKEKDNAHRD